MLPSDSKTIQNEPGKSHAFWPASKKRRKRLFAISELGKSHAF